MGTQAGQMFQQIRGIFVTRITMQTSNFLIGILIKKDTKHFIPIWNFMFKMELQEIPWELNIIFKIGIICWSRKSSFCKYNCKEKIQLFAFFVCKTMPSWLNEIFAFVILDCYWWKIAMVAHLGLFDSSTNKCQILQFSRFHKTSKSVSRD